jgi:hypothetical protein
VTFFESYSFASAPAPAKADRRTPEAAASSQVTRASDRRLWSLIGLAGFVTYGFGLPVILAEYLPR